MNKQLKDLTPTLLTDLTRLPEIYALRVAAWGQSPGAQYVNSRLFPQGWFDALDTHATARHWVVEDDGRIIASARAVLLDTLEESSQADLARFALPAGRPWGYLSRLVISPAYRGLGLAEKFDQVRMAFLRDSGADFALGASFPKRIAMLREQGWEALGPVVWRTAEPVPPVPNHHLCLWRPERSVSAG